MIPSEKVFFNVFDDSRITSFRLSNFTTNAVSRFNTIDVSGIFKVTTLEIVNAHTPFHDGLSEIDTSKGEKKGKTKNVNEVKLSFRSDMGEFENEIARDLGGRDTAAYISFYPKGKTEYTTANKTQMPLLVKRISKLATDNAAALGEGLTSRLQTFVTLWEAALTEESTVSSTLSDGRADRGTLRTNLEMALLRAIYAVGSKYTADLAKCMSFFDFGLLTGASHKTGGDDPTPPAAI